VEFDVAVQLAHVRLYVLLVLFVSRQYKAAGCIPDPKSKWMEYSWKNTGMRLITVLDTWTTARPVKCRPVKWHPVICRCG